MESTRPEDKKGDLPYAVVILGPTGSGKTAVSLEIAQRLNQLNSSQGSSPCLDAPAPTPSTQRFRPADSPTLSARRSRSADNSSPYLGVEIISADSRAIYQGMDIGTAKPTPAEQKQVPHWGLDLVQPGERFTVADWKSYTESKIQEIANRGNLPLVVGGTGLYIDALIYDYSFTKSAQKNYTDRQNLRTNFLTIGVSTPREDLRKNLRQRIDKMFTQELFAETEHLVKTYGTQHAAFTADIYRFVWAYLQGEFTLEQAKEQAFYADWHLARRQMTWFRRNSSILWLVPEQIPDTVLSHLKTKINRENSPW